MANRRFLFMKKVVFPILDFFIFCGVLITVTGCSRDENENPTQDYINYTVKGKVAVTDRKSVV